MSFRIDPGTLDFELPEDLIAQSPAPVRDQARLLVLNRQTGSIAHKRFLDLRDYLRSGDVLVINKAKVSKSKLTGRKVTGGKVEVIFLQKLNGGGHWKALVRPQIKEGVSLTIGGALKTTVAQRFETGEYSLRIDDGNVESVLSSEGRLPLPPYIKREENDPRNTLDEQEYQTVFAQNEGSVAAPTAGLHFSMELLTQLKSMGVQIAEILLNVGWGTFKPIAHTVTDHQMLAESFDVSANAVDTLLRAKKEKRRIVAVGTTSTRTLEALDPKAVVEQKSISGETSLFIRPGFSFQWIDGLITNLHVPRSTPVSLTAAFAGLTNLERSYSAAIEEKYRFFSYGDAMFIH